MGLITVVSIIRNELCKTSPYFTVSWNDACIMTNQGEIHDLLKDTTYTLCLLYKRTLHDVSSIQFFDRPIGGSVTFSIGGRKVTTSINNVTVESVCKERSEIVLQIKT